MNLIQKKQNISGERYHRELSFPWSSVSPWNEREVDLSSFQRSTYPMRASQRQKYREQRYYFFLQLLNYPLIEENILLVSVSTSGPWALWGPGLAVVSPMLITGQAQNRGSVTMCELTEYEKMQNQGKKLGVLIFQLQFHLQ